MNAKTILDVGTGTGVLALMLAQRSGAVITAIEIEENAAAEARENARKSPCNQRIKIIHRSFQDFMADSPGKYDCIVSNPPFYTNNQKSRDSLLAMARHADLLPFTDLARGAAELLANKGILALILPVNAAQAFTAVAREQNLFLKRLAEVKPSPRKEPNRFLLEFSRSSENIQKDSLSIYRNDGAGFTHEYIALTRDFYLNF